MRKLYSTLSIIFAAAIIVSAAFRLSGQAGASYKAYSWPGSSKYTAVRNYADFQKRIRALERANIKVTEITRVTYDKSTYPILGLTYTPPSPPVLRIFLAGGQHGNEPAGAEGVLAFMAGLKANPGELKNVAIDAIPMVNPWGWAHNIRQNANGYDVNRDYVSFVTAEADAVRSFTRGKQYDLVIDHHEASRDGAFVYCYGYDDAPLARDLIRHLGKQGYAIASVGWNRFGTDERGVIAIPGSGYSSVWRGRSVLPRYFASTVGSHAYLMETSTYKAFADRIKVHVSVARFFINGLKPAQ